MAMRAGMIVLNKPQSEHCDICRFPIENIYIDGRTKMGPWANMCYKCYKQHGVGLGTGSGQQWELQTTGIRKGKWIKTAG